MGPFFFIFAFRQRVPRHTRRATPVNRPRDDRARVYRVETTVKPRVAPGTRRLGKMEWEKIGKLERRRRARRARRRALVAFYTAPVWCV